jgi:cobalt-zinc-cadmium efflux system outer membrane protein
LIGILDANGKGDEGFEIGPGINVDLPLFNRNQGGKARTTVEIERASQLYTAARLQVVSEVRSAGIRVAQAEQALEAWSQDIMRTLEVEQRQAESAYQAGEVPLLNVLDVSRRLVDGRMQQLTAEAGLLRSRIARDRAMGRHCR